MAAWLKAGAHNARVSSAQRNAGNLADFSAEMPLYLKGWEIMEHLASRSNQSLFESYVFLYEAGELGTEDMEGAKAWIEDLQDMGVTF